MDYKEREKLKQKISLLMQELIDESWNVNVIESLEKCKTDFDSIVLEGYDD